MNQSGVKKFMALFMVVMLMLTIPDGTVQADRKSKVTKIVLNVKSKEMEVGQKLKLKVKNVKPSKSSKKVKWKSGNSSVATVNKKGMVTAKSAGIVKITATSAENKKVKAFCTVNVQNKETVINQLPNQAGSGVQGAQGEKGNTGEQGLQGEKGEKGDKGDPGEQGLQGEKGEKGDKGDPGEQGLQGEKGDKGDPGEQGLQGEKGDKGDPGASIERAYIDEDGNLILVLSDGTIVNAGPIGTAVLPPDVPVTGTQMYAGTVKAKPGEKNVKVILSVKGNPGILGMTLSVKYNQKALTLKNAENGTAIKDVLTMTTGAVLQSGCKFTWDGENIKDNQIKDGEILVLTFDVADDAQAGSYDIEFIYNDGDIVDKNLDTIDLTVSKGSIVVEND